MRIQRFFISCLLLAATLSAHAFDRPFPKTTKRAEMTIDVYPLVVINDKPRKLSAGARIWNQDNMIQMPTSLRGNKYIVHYTEDMQGQVDRIWILTAAEIALPPPKATPVAVTLPSPD